MIMIKTLAIFFIVLPLSFIFISINIIICTRTVFLSIYKISFKSFSIIKYIVSESMKFIIFPISQIYILKIIKFMFIFFFCSKILLYNYLVRISVYSFSISMILLYITFNLIKVNCARTFA